MLFRPRVIAFVVLSLGLVRSHAIADDVRVLDLSIMTVAERLALAPTTLVKLPSGQTLTMAALLAQHVARVARLSASALPPAAPPGTRKPIGSDFVYLGEGGGVVHSLRSPSPIGATRVRLMLIAPAYADKGWAAPYVNFCSREEASVCLYRPGPSSFTLNYPSTGMMSDIDPLLTPRDCAASGGVDRRGFCYFTYPMSATAKFVPGDPPSAELQGACPAGFIGKIEPKGIVTIAFDPKTFAIDQDENASFQAASSCVMRIFEPASARVRPA